MRFVNVTWSAMLVSTGMACGATHDLGAEAAAGAGGAGPTGSGSDGTSSEGSGGGVGSTGLGASGGTPGGSSTGGSGSGGSGATAGGASSGGSQAGTVSTGGASSSGGTSSIGSGGMGEAGAAGEAGMGGTGGNIPATFDTLKVILTENTVNCSSSDCHGGFEGRPDFRDTPGLYERVTTWYSDICEMNVVTPGNPDQSAILKVLTTGCGDVYDRCLIGTECIPRMPLNCEDGFDCIPPAYIEALRRWIAEGAPE